MTDRILSSEDRVGNALNKRFPDLKCPVCNHESFFILPIFDAEINQELEGFREFLLSGGEGKLEQLETLFKGVTEEFVTTVACQNCGRMEKFFTPVLLDDENTDEGCGDG